jgi:hypothetical protein
VNHAGGQKLRTRERGKTRVAQTCVVRSGQTNDPEPGPEPKNENDPHRGHGPVKGQRRVPGPMPGIGVVPLFVRRRVPGPINLGPILGLVLGLVREGVRYGV